MITRTLSMAALALYVSASGCSIADSGTDSGAASSSSSGDPSADVEAAAALLPVEDVAQYNACRDNGHSTLIQLAQLNADRDPATRAVFTTASCIVGRLTQFQGRFRPYNLQSFKNLPGGETRFFFKRISLNTTGEAPSECLKIKMLATVSPTDVYVTIDRVKQLPPPRADGLCADNGEI